MTVRPIAVVGPTAAGKSALALDLAERLHGDIINIDAMQMYRGMDIGTAKVPVAERRGIVHHQLDVLDVTETATVASFAERARADVERLLAANRTPVIVGGSMMYFQALLDEWEFPATDPQVRARFEERLSTVGSLALHRELAEIDPTAGAKILPSDGRRIVRALEVVTITGRPFAASAPAIGPARWDCAIVVVDRETERLDERIALRTRQMFDHGLADEVRSLEKQGLRDGVTASRAIGYAQVLASFDGEYDLDHARELTFVGTRRYVRRQRSWFRRDPRATWLDGGEPTLLESALRAHSAPVWRP